MKYKKNVDMFLSAFFKRVSRKTFLTAIAVIIGLIVISLAQSSQHKKDDTKQPKITKKFEGYNPILFKMDSTRSPILGQNISRIQSLSKIPINVVSSSGGSLLYNLPISVDSNYSIYEINYAFYNMGPNVESFIVDPYGIVVGYVRLCHDLDRVSTYMRGVSTTPMIVETHLPGDTTRDRDLLCWKLKYGYRYQLTKRTSYKDPYNIWFSYGYFDLIDPRMCSDFELITYKQLDSQNNDGNNIPASLVHALDGTYENKSKKLRIDIPYWAKSGIFRSVINCSDGGSDYFYFDKYEGYEKIDDNTWLIKATCGNTKLTYLFLTKEEDGHGYRSLYYNDSDGWDYSDNYNKNAILVESRKYTVVDCRSNNNNVNNKKNASTTKSASNDQNVTDSASRQKQASSISTNNNRALSTNATNSSKQAQHAYNEYILCTSDTEYIDRDYLESLSLDELRLARNEIYARHGRTFKSDDLLSYFESKSWYQPLYSPDEFDAMGDSIFNQYEITNRDLIVEVENSKK